MGVSRLGLAAVAAVDAHAEAETQAAHASAGSCARTGAASRLPAGARHGSFARRTLSRSGAAG